MICPTCKRNFDATKEASSEPRRPLPFCSNRCRMADLGSWLDGRYRIPTTTDDQDLDTESSADKAPPDADPVN